ncbi:DUF4328 domain-containing protein [Nocardia sp. NPDC050406]|uniref:DUF4328 domain-containing protein n=1 Tax=Nocardia sp. NPDC050406 TaxID=3364318 RepID=UPI00378A2CD1
MAPTQLKTPWLQRNRTMSQEREAMLGQRGLRPLASLGTWTLAAIAASVVMSLVSAIADGITYADFENSRAEEGEWQSPVWIGVVWLLLQLASAVLFIVWMWRARLNAEALCLARHRRSRGWVIGGWFCPVVNAWFPQMIMSDIVRASDPRTPSDARDLRARPASPLVGVWWTAWLATWVLTWVSVRLSAPEWESETTEDYYVTTMGPQGGWSLIVVEVLISGTLAVAAISLGAIMIRVQGWQEIRSAERQGS